METFSIVMASLLGLSGFLFLSPHLPIGEKGEWEMILILGGVCTVIPWWSMRFSSGVVLDTLVPRLPLHFLAAPFVWCCDMEGKGLLMRG